MKPLTLSPALAQTRPVRLAFGHAASIIASSLLVLLAGAARAESQAEADALRPVAMATSPSAEPSARRLDDRYAATLHDEIAAAARYPNSREARQLRPKGRVGMWVELDRSGQLVDARIVSGSGQNLLDMEALRNVRNGRYAAFPAAAFAGENSHRFALTLEYELAQR